jgi:20S proteasome subunit beta 7
MLGCCNLLGTTYEASTIATGFGGHLAQPILREAVEGREEILAEEEAQSILEKCMTILWYRDARSTDKVCLSIEHFIILIPLL